MLPCTSAGECAQAIYSTGWVRLVMVLLLANVIMGLLVAWQRKVFELSAVGSWLRSRALPLLLGAGVAKLVMLVLLSDPTFPVALSPAWADLVWAFALLELVGHLAENFRELGLPLPAFLGAHGSDAPSPPLPTHVEPPAPMTAHRRVLPGPATPTPP